MASLGTNLTAAIAFNRFGLGGRPDDSIPASPQSWLIGQLAGPDPYSGAGMPSTATALKLFADYQTARSGSDQTQYAAQMHHMLVSEIDAYMTNALTTQAPFRERLVWFWTNHFALMAQHAGVSACAGAYVREAIRPNVNRTFQDMLLAVMQHPAMLISLNNIYSAGPDSPAAQKCQATGCTTIGINENLGRECLELHTLGINGGYVQADVDALAMLISGWSINLSQAPFGFLFKTGLHEPRPQTLMGRAYAATQLGGLDALSWLATQPATYLHLATKLVTHFVSDTPAPSDVATIATVLRNTGGNLAAASTALVNLPSAWRPYTKLRTPMDYVVAVLRASGATGPGSCNPANPRFILQTLGTPVWQPQFPNGYADTAADWMGPAQALLRTDWINSYATQVTALDPATVAGCALGPLLRPSTTTAINAATLSHDKLSMLFLSPEFQRR